MMLDVFSVLDTAVSAFLPPFFARSKGEAIRSFTEASNDSSHQFAKHASDYVLYRLGAWDDHSGMFSGSEPERIGSAREFVVDPVRHDRPPLVGNGSIGA
ncbi:nonstructural protein [robinz microvirus RP_30]|nr:nonstructural protein [robinz microvirus RP_29]UDN67487.1 nonstructural protein [robinz microvirus RP_30]